MGHKIDDRVRVRCDGSRVDGQITTITSGLVPARQGMTSYMGYTVDIPCSGNYFFCIFEPHELIPIDDDSSEVVDEILKRIDKTITRELVHE